MRFHLALLFLLIAALATARRYRRDPVAHLRPGAEDQWATWNLARVTKLSTVRG